MLGSVAMAPQVKRVFSKNLRRWMRIRGVGAQDAADAVGCYAKDAYNWQSGRSLPGLLYMRRLIRFLGVDFEDLMEGCE